MHKAISEGTIALIRKHIPKIGVTLPIRDEEDVQIIADYFEEMEVCLSNALSDGEKIDRSELDAAAKAFDELAMIEDDDCHDLEDLNKRLMSQSSQ